MLFSNTFKLNIVDYLINWLDAGARMIRDTNIAWPVTSIKGRWISLKIHLLLRVHSVLVAFSQLIVQLIYSFRYRSAREFAIKMIAKFLFVCLLGLGVQNVHSWSETGRLSELDEVKLSNTPVCKYFLASNLQSRKLTKFVNCYSSYYYPFTDMGGHRHQLNCIGEKELCEKYEQDPIFCKVKGTKEESKLFIFKYLPFKSFRISLTLNYPST